MGPGPAQIALRGKGVQDIHDLQWYRDFLAHHVADLEIQRHLAPFRRGRPVFLVAATGVGKTVAVPLAVLIDLCDELLDRRRPLRPAPFVLVVEPTIPICRDEAAHMNDAFVAFMAGRGRNVAVPPFGAVTGPFRENAEAPVRFVTTGVFERMAERLDGTRCRVVVDEAHRVLAQSPGVEIAARLAANRGVTVHWMSATVDTRDIESRFEVSVVRATDVRYPVLRLPTGRPLDDCIGDLAVRALRQPQTLLPATGALGATAQDSVQRTRLHLLSTQEFVDPVDGKRYPGLRERAQGMLVIVNSFRGERSDTRRVARRIEGASKAAGDDIEVLELASPVIRDPERHARFLRRVKKVESRRGRYVIVSTNVVELGVTIPMLDYVVTVDTELTNGPGGLGVEERPLSANSFHQRIGRVGRRRPGLAFLTREGDHGADYSAWTAEALQDLGLEPISFGMLSGNVRSLALFSDARGIENTSAAMRDFIVEGRLPSRPERHPPTLDAVSKERKAIAAAGLSDGRSLTARGRRFSDIGVVNDLELGALLAEALERDDPSLTLLALVTAAVPGGLRDLLARGADLDGEAPMLARRVAFARERFSAPVEEVVAALRAGRTVTADAATAHHVQELLAAGYQVADPIQRRVKREQVEASALTLTHACTPLDVQAEPVAAYQVVQWFFQRFNADLHARGVEAHEKERAREALREEARLSGFDPGALMAVFGRMHEIGRHAGVELESPEKKATMSEAVLTRLVAAAVRARPDLAATHARSVILEHVREALPSRREGLLPPAPADLAHRLAQSLESLNILTPVRLRWGTDHRDEPALVGRTRHAGQDVEVVVERRWTTLRPPEDVRVRGQIVRVPYVDSDGDEAERFTLALGTVVGA